MIILLEKKDFTLVNTANQQNRRGFGPGTHSQQRETTMKTEDILNHYFLMLEKAVENKTYKKLSLIQQIVRVIEEIYILNEEKVDYKRINLIQFKGS